MPLLPTVDWQCCREAGGLPSASPLSLVPPACIAKVPAPMGHIDRIKPANPAAGPTSTDHWTGQHSQLTWHKYSGSFVQAAPLLYPIHSTAGPSSTEDSASANDEIIRERLLRELTQEYASLLKELATRTVGGGNPVAAAAAGAAAAGAAAAAGGGGAGGGGKSVLEWLLETDPTTGFQAATTAVAGMCWRDDAAFRFAQLAKTLVGVAPRDQRLYAYVGSEVLKAAISSLATEVGGMGQSVFEHVAREVDGLWEAGARPWDVTLWRHQ